MYQKLYPGKEFPKGHPDLAFSLNHMGFVLRSMGQPERALIHFENALKCTRGSFPVRTSPRDTQGLARSLYNIGFVLESLGKPEPALIHLEQALKMSTALLEQEATLAPEAEALDFGHTLPDVRNLFLALARRTGAPDDSTYFRPLAFPRHPHTHPPGTSLRQQRIR